MEYTTSTGATLVIGRIHRRLIDNLIADNPPPVPPTKTVRVWEGEEGIPDHNDPVYLAQKRAYDLQVGMVQFDVVAAAITFFGEKKDASELATIGVGGSENNAALLQALSHDDLVFLVDEVFYQSTVTARGIDEAEKRFGVIYMEQPVMAWKVPGSAAVRNQVFADWQAARFCGYDWQRFCELSGPAQSECVAFHMISNRLDWLMQKYKGF